MHFWSWILFFPGIFLLVEAGYHQKRLLNYLFDKSRKDAHNKLERPVRNESEAVQVRFGTSLTQLLDVDEKNQIIKSSIMLQIVWKDYQFHWNPEEFGGVSILNVDPSLVWIPDVLLYNSADDNFNAANPVMVNVHNDGRLSYTPPGLFKSTCVIDVQWFPFDKQECTLKFGTWSYNGNDVDVKIYCPNDELMMNNGNCSIYGPVDLAYYLNSGEWELLSAEMKRNRKVYDCCPEAYVDVKVILKIQRRALYYLFNFVLPCIIISIMALVDFLLPSDAGEKISLGVTVMLSLSMFQLILADLMPQSSLSSPLLAVYFCSMMALSSLSILFTVLVLSCHHNDHEIPAILKICVNQWLCRLLFIAPISSLPNKPKEVKVTSLSNVGYQNNQDQSPQHYHEEVAPTSSLLVNVLGLPSDTHNIYHDVLSRRRSLMDLETCLDNSEYQTNNHPRSIESPLSINEYNMSCSLQTNLHDIRMEMEFITSKIKESDEEGDLLKEWKFAAFVIDRFCLVTFSTLAVAVTAGIFIVGGCS